MYFTICREADFIFFRSHRLVQFILSRPDGSNNSAVNQEIRSGDEACILSQQKCAGL